MHAWTDVRAHAVRIHHAVLTVHFHPSGNRPCLTPPFPLWAAAGRPGGNKSRVGAAGQELQVLQGLRHHPLQVV